MRLKGGFSWHTTFRDIERNSSRTQVVTLKRRQNVSQMIILKVTFKSVTNVTIHFNVILICFA